VKYVPASPSGPAPVDSTSPDARATAFEAGAPIPEAHSGTKLLVTAYVLIWIIVMVFVQIMWLRQRGIAKRLATLESAIDRKDKETASKDK
jgi:hypothetical protein